MTISTSLLKQELCYLLHAYYIKKHSQEFEKRLEILDTEIINTINAYYTYKAIITKIKNDNPLLYKLNRHSYFWKTIIDSLLNNFIISLGRIFDETQKDDAETLSINKFIAFCQKEKIIFSKEYLYFRRYNDNNWPSKDALIEYVSVSHRYLMIFLDKLREF